MIGIVAFWATAYARTPRVSAKKIRRWFAAPRVMATGRRPARSEAVVEREHHLLEQRLAVLDDDLGLVEPGRLDLGLAVVGHDEREVAVDLRAIAVVLEHRDVGDHMASLIGLGLQCAAHELDRARQGL